MPWYKDMATAVTDTNNLKDSRKKLTQKALESLMQDRTISTELINIYNANVEMRASQRGAKSILTTRRMQ